MAHFHSNALIGAGGQGGAADYQIDRSLRFDTADSAYLNRIPSSASGDRSIWTLSFWIKICNFSLNKQVFTVYSDGSNDSVIRINGNNYLEIYNYRSGSYQTQYISDVQFRDPSAWYHFVVSANGSTSLNAWVNGEAVTWSTSSGPNGVAWLFNNTGNHQIGRYNTNVNSNFYLAEVNWIDGQALAETDFGEANSNGVWQPKEFSGTYGTNGFYLKFADNSSNSALGTDSSGNSNTFTVNNLSATGVTPPTATVVGDPTSSTDNPFGVGQGHSVDFDGNDEIRFTGPGTVTGDLTIECFYKMSSAASGYQRIFSTKEDSYSTEQTIIRRHTNGNLQFYFGNGTPEHQSGSISSGTWRHAAIVYDRSAGTVSYYDHGSRAGTDSYSSDVPITLMVAGGGYGSENFQGLISNARITKQALYSGSSYTVPTSTLTTTSQGATASNVTLLCCHQSSTTAVEGGSGSSADIDSLIDTPTNYTPDSGNAGGNYATLNLLDRKSTVSLSNGNLDATTSSTGWAGVKGTIGVSSGKYYFEATANGPAAYYQFFGICASSVKPDTSGYLQDDSTERAKGMLLFCDNGQYQLDGNSRVSYSSSMTDGDVIAIAYDLDNNTVQFYKNGSALGSIDISSSPLASATVVPLVIRYNTNTTYHLNFGQRPFAYTPPTGYVSLCTQNLPDPTIADGSTAFDAKLWTGDGNTGRDITGYSFSPDWVWIKQRSDTRAHALFDTVRGANKRLQSDTTNAETTHTDQLSAFLSNGFTIEDNNTVNASSGTYVGWAWDAGTSTVSNTDGSITSSVRANASAGISVVGFTGNGSAATIGHGLNAAPELILLKNRQSTQLWYTYHKPLGANKYLYLNRGDAAQSDPGMWNNVEPTSSVFTVGSYALSNNYIAYCFAPVEGFSAFGSYIGNGVNDGTFIYTGFRPRWVMVKSSSNSGEHWLILDTKRDPYNLSDATIYANLNNSEYEAGALGIDILSNGFKPRGTNAGTNASGYTYVYAAFAEHPFKTARAR